MIVYFDESYDNARHYILYGALFVPLSSRLHQSFLRIRREMEFRPEIKYNRCRDARALRVCQRLIDAFIADTAYFRCIAVDQHGFDYDKFRRPDESLEIAKARAYKKFAELLLEPHVSQGMNAVLLADALTRCEGDKFLERIHERFNPPGAVPTFRHMAEVSSEIEEYQCLQVCDLLLGCVLNNLKPTDNAYKNDIRQYLCLRLNVDNLLLSTWKDTTVKGSSDPSKKFHVRYWSAKKWPR